MRTHSNFKRRKRLSEIHDHQQHNRGVDQTFDREHITDTRMLIEVRDTLPEETEAIFRLRNNPSVLDQQYRPSPLDTPESYAQRMTLAPAMGKYSFRSTSILCDGIMVGHVMQNFSLAHAPAHSRCVCGWNLDPDYWGRGIMPRAANKLFDRLFEAQPELRIIVACFDTNTRCLRVIEKLGFKPQKMTLADRFGHLTQTWGKKKVIQFSLTKNCRPS